MLAVPRCPKFISMMLVIHGCEGHDCGIQTPAGDRQARGRPSYSLLFISFLSSSLFHTLSPCRSMYKGKGLSVNLAHVAARYYPGNTNQDILATWEEPFSRARTPFPNSNRIK